MKKIDYLGMGAWGYCLASLLSQGLDCHQTALLGTYLHGLAGELAVKKRGTSYGMMASDLIDHFSSAYAFLQQ